ncbi:MAG: 1-acyl-sn-glycerol-3-phosphate acyltransferase [Nannocystaceae bacterium]|nr:1-acyl-sn-glycerol-3-phosphate acyltransferase [Nannocystaceae bacterium]
MTAARSTYLTREFLPSAWRRMREAAIHTMIRGVVHTLYRFKKTRLDHVPEGPAVLVCNHVSFADALIVGAAFPRPVRFVMDHRIYNHPALRWFFDAVGVIPIARAKDDPRLLEQAYDRIASALRRGELVCIFPEGMITHDGALNRFRDGITRIAQRSSVPVIPLALKGMWGSFFSRRGGPAMRQLPRRCWSKIELVAARPLAPTTLSAAEVQECVARLLAGQCAASSSRNWVDKAA